MTSQVPINDKYAQILQLNIFISNHILLNKLINCLFKLVFLCLNFQSLNHFIVLFTFLVVTHELST